MIALTLTTGFEQPDEGNITYNGDDTQRGNNVALLPPKHHTRLAQSPPQSAQIYAIAGLVKNITSFYDRYHNI
jgi:hypothetical protein